MPSSRLLLILIPLLPFLAAVVTAILGPRLLKQRSHWPVIVACLGSFVCSFILATQVRDQIVAQRAPDATAELSNLIGYEEIHSLWTWAWVAEAYPSDAQPFPPGSGDPLNAAATAAAMETAEGSVAAGPRDWRIDVALRADPLTVIMLVMVTFISSLVAIYAAGYMEGDRGYWRFFSYVSLFVFSMTMLVSVSNFLLLFVFWEAVGLCSYLLIGFWYEKPSAVSAGMKAFLVNRIGDFGFALALFLIWTTYGTWNFHDTLAMDGGVLPGVLGQTRLASGAFAAGGIGIAICLLLMLGACGKSAQFPLHVWLPDAMEGPTPVSALIHAATMVTAGVYMVTRCTPLFMVSPTAQFVVASVGGGTALMAGLIAITQFDLKRVLAYSTISQLGYMFLGLGTGTLAGITAGMFHLFTHAFFKALLFLGSGSVMHAMGGVIDMRRFGGLRRLLPITHWTFAFGCLALAGLFPFSGFWSKDAIIGSVHDQAVAMESELAHRRPPEAATGDGTAMPSKVAHQADDHGHGPHEEGLHAISTAYLQGHTTQQLETGAKIYHWLYYISLGAAFLTAVYTFRAFFMTFYGEEEVPLEAGSHAHESPPTMWVPLAILAAFAVAVGFMLERSHLFSNLLCHTPSLATTQIQATPLPGVFHLDVALMSSLIAVVGISLAAFFYLGDRKEAAAVARLFDSSLIGKPYRWSLHKFFFDEIYGWCIVKPLAGLASLAYLFDRWVVDGLVNLGGWIPKALGGVLRGLNMGFVPFYGLVMVLGMLSLLAARAVWGG